MPALVLASASAPLWALGVSVACVTACQLALAAMSTIRDRLPHQRYAFYVAPFEGFLQLVSIVLSVIVLLSLLHVSQFS